MADAADFRRIALSLHGVAEYPHFDRRAFKARVTFATLAPDELSANIKFAPDEQALKCAVAPDAFAALDNAWGRQGWTRATLAALSEPELSGRSRWLGATAQPRPRSARRAARPEQPARGHGRDERGRPIRSKLSQLLARLPQPLRRRVVARRRRRLRDLALDEILAARFFDLK